MKARAAAPWLIAVAWAAVRLAFPPPGHNTHTIMYPLVEAAGSYNTLEPFHPLYVPVVALVRRAWEAAGGTGPALPALQLLSLLAGMANLVLIHRLALRLTGKEGAAAGAAVLAATGQNLWAWSLQTTSYTLATAFALAASERALVGGRPSLRGALWSGACAGLAASFDTAAGLIAAPLLWEARHSRREAAAFLGALAAVLLGSYAALFWRLSGLGWPFPPTLQGLLSSLPRDIVPLWRSGDLPGQLRALLRSDAPLDLFFLAAPLLVGLYPRTLDPRPRRFAAAFFSAVLAFFFANDPGNRFLYAGALFMPLLAVLARPKAWPALAAASLLFNAVHPPRYAARGNPSFDEADFLAARLGPRDLLVALSDPDWLLAYGLRGRVPVLKLARPGDASARFGQAVAPAGAPAERLMDETLCRGGRVLFAPDALYRSSLLDAASLQKDAQALVARWSQRYAPGPALVSPQGQHYMPLSPRPGACPGPGGRPGLDSSR